MFTIPIPAAVRGTVSVELKSLLDINYKDVKVSFFNGFRINWDIGAPRNPGPGLADKIEADISAALQTLLSKGMLPEGEKWTISRDRA